MILRSVFKGSVLVCILYHITINVTGFKTRYVNLFMATTVFGSDKIKSQLYMLLNSTVK